MTSSALLDAIALAREVAAALAKATREGEPPERIDKLRAMSRAAERRVGELAS